MLTLRVDDILTGTNIRGEVGDISSLVSSIDRHGLLQLPLVVKSDDESGTYVLVAGHRRLAAIKELEWSTVDVIVEDIFESAADVIAAQFHENMQRLDLTDWERLQVAYDLKLEGLKQADVATAMGVPKSEVSKAQKIVKALRADEDLDDTVASQFTSEALFEVAEGPIPEKAGEVLKRVSEGTASVWGAVRDIQHETELVEFYDTIGELQKEWSEAGVQITTTEPALHLGKKDQWGQVARDRKVERLDSQFGLDIQLGDHIGLDCHMIWIADGSEGYGRSPSVTHWCMNKTIHGAKGKSELKTADAESVEKRRLQSSVERKKERDEKQLRRDQVAEWIFGSHKQADMLVFATAEALTGWRSDHTKTACDILGLTKDRPKGAEFNWYDKQLGKWLKDEFGDKDNEKARLWKVRLLQGHRFVEQQFPAVSAKEQLEAIKIEEK